MKLAAGAVTAGIIAAGAITTDKLAVGSGTNLLTNSTFSFQTDFWDMVSNHTGGTPTLVFRATGQTYTGGNSPTLMIFQNFGNDGTGKFADIRQARPDVSAGSNLKYGYPCTAGETYEASVYSVVLSCTAELYIEWRNSSGRLLVTPQEAHSLFRMEAPPIRTLGRDLLPEALRLRALPSYASCLGRTPRVLLLLAMRLCTSLCFARQWQTLPKLQIGAMVVLSSSIRTVLLRTLSPQVRSMPRNHFCQDRRRGHYG